MDVEALKRMNALETKMIAGFELSPDESAEYDRLLEVWNAERKPEPEEY